MEQFNGFGGWDLELGRPSRFAFLEESLEGFVQAAAPSALHQSSGDMRPPGRLAIRQGKDRLDGQGHAQSVQPLDHVVDALAAHRLESDELLLQGVVLWVQIVTQHMKLVAVELGGNLRSWNEF